MINLSTKHSSPKIWRKSILISMNVPSDQNINLFTDEKRIFVTKISILSLCLARNYNSFF